MIRLACFVFAALIALPVFAGERIAGTNSYVLNEEIWSLQTMNYWRQDNYGTFTVTEGPIDPGFVQCIGAGFGEARGVRGEGICIFGIGEDTFTWAWQANPGEPNTWQVIDATGKYKGMRGEGTAISRIASEFMARQHRVTSWQGEITLPE